MSGIVTTVRSAALAASVLAAIGFGAGQALAAPPDIERGAVCIPEACNLRCEAQYGPFAAGYCEDGVCKCAV